jgi:hypothetical protein
MFLQRFLKIIGILRVRYIRGRYWLKCASGRSAEFKNLLFAVCSSKMRWNTALLENDRQSISLLLDKAYLKFVYGTSVNDLAIICPYSAGHPTNRPRTVHIVENVSCWTFWFNVGLNRTVPEIKWMIDSGGSNELPLRPVYKFMLGTSGASFGTPSLRVSQLGSTSGVF